MLYVGAECAGWNSVLLARSLFLYVKREKILKIKIGKLSYEDFSPAMVADTSIPLHRPKRLLSLHDLYPYINNLSEGEEHKQTTCSL